MILYEDAALVVLDKPAGLSSEEGVPAALRAHWNAPDAFVGVIFRLNARYGEHGLMKLLAEKRHPRYLIHRKRVFRLFTRRRKKQQS